MNIAHLHVRLARQAGERDGQLGATITLTQARPARLISVFCGIAGPVNRGDVAKAGTAHGLFIEVERRAADAMPATPFAQIRSARMAVKRDPLSSREDRCYPARRIGDMDHGPPA